MDIMISISKAKSEDVFVQTNIIKCDKDMFTLEEERRVIPISDCSYLDISEEDCIELAKTLSHCVNYTSYEDKEHNITEFADGEIISQYKNE